MQQGYHQLLLDPQSSRMATFSTPWGNMRPKRLIFGAKASQDLFNEAIYRIFGDILRCLNQRDDILLGGKTMEEHNVQQDIGSSPAESSGVWNHIQRQVPVWSRVDRVLWTQVHERRIKAKPRENQSCETKQPARIKRSCKKFPWHDQVSIKVHPKICITNRTASPLH